MPQALALPGTGTFAWNCVWNNRNNKHAEYNVPRGSTGVRRDPQFHETLQQNQEQSSNHVMPQSLELAATPMSEHQVPPRGPK